MSEPVVVVQSERTRTRRGARRDVLAGLGIAVVGLVLLLPAVVQGLALPDLRSYMVLFIGIALLIAWLFWRNGAILGAGAVMTGVGIGIALRAASPPEDALAVFLIGVGIGFLLVWLLALVTRGTENYLWPLVPGIVLVGSGLLEMFPEATAGLSDTVRVYWPIALVAIGLVVLVGALFARRARTA